jgi:VIT1/CCC1 family predicted Fe2+/Mn2+ transporter
MQSILCHVRLLLFIGIITSVIHQVFLDKTNYLRFIIDKLHKTINMFSTKMEGENKHMPQTPHIEQHFTASETIRDIVIGMSDGLTVPFALAAGLSGAVSSTNIIVTAGLAEIAAGSIAMGLGGYLAARGDAEHYASERQREQLEVKEKTEVEKQEVRDIFASYGLTAEQSAPIVETLSKHSEAWIDFMMRFELGLEKPDPKRALTSALTVG